MHSTHLRREQLHGLMLGVAIGNALGYCRNGLPRRMALRMYGRPPLDYRLLSSRGIYSNDTRLMLLNAQALLQSRSDLRSFRRIFQSRFSWYLLSLPISAGTTTLVSSAKCSFAKLRLPSGVNSNNNEAATRAVFSALAMHGTGHRLSKWTEESTKLTHTHPLAVDGCQVLAALADYAATTKPIAFQVEVAIEAAMAASSTKEIREKLNSLLPFLKLQRSPSAVARHFGWRLGVPSLMEPTTVMATYCFLRYPSNFRRAVESAIALGGTSATLGAVVGGLVGGHLGSSLLPKDLTQRLVGYPHGTTWIKKMAERLSHWPHGSDDLHLAPAQSTDPPLQLIRNLSIVPLILVNSLMRIPYRLLKKL